MNFETVLLYNFDEGEKARKIKMVLLKMKVKIKKCQRSSIWSRLDFWREIRRYHRPGTFMRGKDFRGNACDERIYKQQDRLAIKGVSKSGNRES